MFLHQTNTALQLSCLRNIYKSIFLKKKNTKLIIVTYVLSNTEPIYAKKCNSENMSVISLLRQGDDMCKVIK